ncbi:hypothetical protein GQ457_05G016610 [Hibiscus cannabinus]
MIILHNYPLAMVEHVGFKIFFRNLQPLFELVTCNKVEADCMEIYAKEKQKVYEIFDKLPGKISVSADIWTASDGSAAYLSLAAYYIDEDWQLKNKILNFVTIDPSYAEDMHSGVIMNCLMDWDVDRKLFSMIFDSFTSENIVDRIRDRLSQNRFLYCNGQLFDVRCVIDLLNCMAHDALEDLGEVTQKIRESVCYFKSSEAAHATFIELADEVQGLDWQESGIPGSAKDSRDRIMGFDKFVHETCQAEGSNSYLDKYLEEPLFPRNVDFNVLNWWKVQSPRYPILSMMARNILGIPISRVTSESRFDTGGRVLDHNWSSLPPTTIQALVCAQDWIQSELAVL